MLINLGDVNGIDGLEDVADVGDSAYCGPCAGLGDALAGMKGAKGQRVRRHLRALGAVYAKGAKGGKRGLGGMLGDGEGDNGENEDEIGGVYGLGDVDGLGDLDMSDNWPTPKELYAEEARFDGVLNAFLSDVQRVYFTLPPSFGQQIDDYVARWRAWKNSFTHSFYLSDTQHRTELVGFQAQFNTIRDQYLKYGKTTAMAPSTATVDGKSYRSDQLPAQLGLGAQIERIVKYGAIVAGSVVMLKLSSDLGLIVKLKKMIA